MERLSTFIYTFVIRCYGLGIWGASFVNEKAALWIEGRQQLFSRLKKVFRDRRNPEVPLIWFHCASLGEFEQARPLIERFKKDTKSPQILITFFSPSGYEVRKDYELADFVFYLPLDTPGNASEFLSITQPDLALFIKYEFWYNFISQTAQHDIPVYLVSAVFRPYHIFFQWYGGLFYNLLFYYTHLFVQDEESYLQLKLHEILHTSISGDTRIDRVAQITENAEPLPILEKFVDERPVFIAGSSYRKEEDHLTRYWQETERSLKYVIAPHEIDETHINRLTELYGKTSVHYSEAEKTDLSDKEVLIIDNIGLLAQIYQYGTIALIGGGWNSNIHNILEPATFGLPVIFGPKYYDFKEANELIEEKGVFSIKRYEEFKVLVDHLLDDEEFYQHTSETCRNYIQANKGATDQVYEALMKKLTTSATN